MQLSGLSRLFEPQSGRFKILGSLPKSSSQANELMWFANSQAFLPARSQVGSGHSTEIRACWKSGSSRIGGYRSNLQWLPFGWILALDLAVWFRSRSVRTGTPMIMIRYAAFLPREFLCNLSPSVPSSRLPPQFSPSIIFAHSVKLSRLACFLSSRSCSFCSLKLFSRLFFLELRP